MNDTLLRCGAKLAARAQRFKHTIDERVAMEGVAQIIFDSCATIDIHEAKKGRKGMRLMHRPSIAEVYDIVGLA